MMAARELDQADFDLDRFVDMFDEAMTSKDPRVIETLRSLMMIVTLTRPEAGTEHGRRAGPLRRLFEDMYNLNRRVDRMEEDLHKITREIRHEEQRAYNWVDQEKYTLQAASSQMAQVVDQAVINQFKLAAQAKGLTKK